MDISVIIPTRERPAKLAECLRCLREQTIHAPVAPGLSGRFEVLVGVDGPDPASVRVAREIWGEVPHAELRVVECPRSGLAAVRNRLLDAARGRWILSINDDVYARAGFVETHIREQFAALERGRPAIIVGDSPWRVFEHDSLFDRLVRETSMIFFYDQMVRRASDDAPAEASRPADHDWGFRHCFGLNFSVSAGAIKEIGGFAVFPATYGYEDNEAAWRIRERFGMPVLFRPQAIAVHDHRYSPADYLQREEKLGYAAWGFAQQSPGCAQEMFGRDITSAEEIEYSNEFVRREAKGAERLREALMNLANIPADVIGGAHARHLIEVTYQQHLLLKRWLWRKGLAQAAAEAGAVVQAA